MTAGCNSTNGLLRQPLLLLLLLNCPLGVVGFSGNSKEWIASNEVLPQEYYKQVYDEEGSKIPWDVGGPQPTVVEWAKKGVFGRGGGKVLDCGCGMGENSVFLAQQHGCEVTGFDLSSKAIETARTRSSAARFVVASCLDLPNAPFATERFDTALDSACLHCLSDKDAMRYVRDLAQLVTDRAYVGCFSTANPPHNWSNPRRISRQDLQRYFCPENGWNIVDIHDKWWARPDSRGSNQGAFCQALWMEAKRISN